MTCAIVDVGKGGNFKKAAAIAYGGDEVSVRASQLFSYASDSNPILCTILIQLDVYEILLGDMNALKWVDVQGPLNVGSLGANPVE